MALDRDSETVTTIRLRGRRIATRGLNNGHTLPNLCNSPRRSRAVARSRPKAISVGQSGEQSLKRIESAGERASGGLKGLGRQAELLRTGIRTLSAALAGVATVGGFAALVDRSISAANTIGKTADTIGVGVEALQELRFAAKASVSSSRPSTWRCSACRRGGRGGARHRRGEGRARADGHRAA